MKKFKWKKANLTQYFRLMSIKGHLDLEPLNNIIDINRRTNELGFEISDVDAAEFDAFLKKGKRIVQGTWEYFNKLERTVELYVEGIQSVSIKKPENKPAYVTITFTDVTTKEELNKIKNGDWHHPQLINYRQLCRN